MAKITKDNTSNPFGVDSGMYDAKVTDCEVKEGKKGSKFLVWSFQINRPILDGEELDEPRVVTGPTPMNLSDGNNLDKLLIACNICTEDGDQVDTDDVIGCKVRVFVEDSKSGDRIFSKVTKVLPRINRKSKSDNEENPKPKVEKESAKKTSNKERKNKPKLEPEEQDEPSEEPDDDDFGDLTDFSDDDDD